MGETSDELERIVESWRGLERTLLVEVTDEEVGVRQVGERESDALAAEDE